MTRCHYLKPRLGGQCTAEAVDEQGEILLCTRHLALALELLQARGVPVAIPAAAR